jgi:hypothetical protein
MGGYELQCDACGYHRKSYFMSDGGKPPTNYRGIAKAFKNTSRLPDGWYKWLDSDDDAHICPDCTAHLRRK